MASTEHVSDLRADLERRQTALSAALTVQAVEAVVIASESNFTYLTGYRTGGAMPKLVTMKGTSSR